MKTSHNVLIIESISNGNAPDEYDDHGYITHLSHNIEINFVFEFRCSASGMVIRRIKTSTRGYHPDIVEALRSAIEDFLNGKWYNLSHSITNNESKSSVDFSEIHAIKYDHLGDDLKAIFDQIFNTENWENFKLRLT